MKILAIEKEKEGVVWDNEQEILEQEAKRVEGLIKTGQLKEIYFTERNSSVLLLETENKKKADEIINSLPLVKSGLSTFDIMELNPFTNLNVIPA